MEKQTTIHLTNIDSNTENQSLSGDYPIEQAQQILYIDKKQRQKNWEITPGQPFGLKADGTITPTDNTAAKAASNDPGDNTGH